MKPYTNLYPQVCSWENLLLAYAKARKGKRGQTPAASFERKLEYNLIDLRNELVARTYQPGAYHSFYIHEPKRRLISAAPFRDRVAHHALCNIIEPIFERSFIFDSYANRKEKGTHRAIDRAQFFARRYEYVLQLDVTQFFPSIDHALLRDALQRKIGDADVLNLCAVIMRSGVGVQTEEYDMVYFPGDDLFAARRPRGLPIGNLTSQFWANVYLNAFDHFVKRELKCPAYVRYVDDLLLFADDKRLLWQWRDAALGYLAKLRLTVHVERAAPYPSRTGIPFLGFNIFPEHRRLKSQKVISFRQRLRTRLADYAARRITIDEVHATVRGWINHVRYGDTWGLRRAVFGGFTL